MDPEGNGVTKSEGAEGGPGPPGGEQDKQITQMDFNEWRWMYVKRYECMLKMEKSVKI